MKAYNGFVAESVKVPKEEFERVIRALLNTPPTPMADIPRKRIAPEREPNRTKGPRNDIGPGGRKKQPCANLPAGPKGPGLGRRP